MLPKRLLSRAGSNSLIGRLSAPVLFVSLLMPGADVPTESVLEHIRAGVLRQLTTVSNYTCVESVDRTYLWETYPRTPGCDSTQKKPKHLYMHDRLRLDVAVSDGQEIFSWHGGKSFSSKGIDDVVQSGPASSGSFVGYLRNIFFQDGVLIHSTGQITSPAGDLYAFDYVVPKQSSRYQIGANGKRWTVPFHGKFTANKVTYQMNSLQVIADEMPHESDVCDAGSEIEYQLVNISGKASLVPKNYVLNMGSSNHLYTISRTEYAQCRAFLGESKLSFDMDDHAAQEKPVVRDKWLSAGTALRVRLRTPLDDRLSFTGDPVEGYLVDSVKVKGSGIVIPKDAVLSGVITKLEFYNDPFKHYLVSIRFHRLTFGRNSFLLDAAPLSSTADEKMLAYYYGGHIPPQVQAGLENGLFLWATSHFHKDQRFVADWRTKPPPAEQPE